MRYSVVFVFILPETTTETTSVTPETTTTPAPTTTLTETTILATTSFTAESTTAVPSPPPPTTTTLETTTETTSVTPAIFYPFGAKAGDIEILENGGDTYYHVVFSTPFTYFGRTYNSIYVNNNGLLTFNHSLPETNPYPFPAYGAVDYIAPLLTDLNDLGIGKYSYQEYTSGSVLTRATQDINQYFPGRDFTASWVFVATWDYVRTWDMNVFNQHSGPAITVQAVLISDGGFSYIQIHYGDCAGIPAAVGAGYDTKGSTDYYQIHYDPYGGYSIPNLKNTTNVGVPGRWAFLVNNGSETVIGVQMKLQSFSNLAQRENSDAVLQIIKQELIKYGVSSKFELKLRKLQKINP
uniref:NIDO domain-containing protein n=1 Tax=Cyprinus carpio carpio TaxID=630221 RepID=A0A8C1AS52_CYPCA